MRTIFFLLVVMLTVIILSSCNYGLEKIISSECESYEGYGINVCYINLAGREGETLYCNNLWDDFERGECVRVVNEMWQK